MPPRPHSPPSPSGSPTCIPFPATRSAIAAATHAPSPCRAPMGSRRSASHAPSLASPGSPAKCRTPWILHDVVQKPPRPRARAVLIVDPSVDMSLVRRRNQLRRRVVVMVAPLFHVHRPPHGALPQHGVL